MEEQASVATKEEIKAMRHRCYVPMCKRYAFLEDWMGWRNCFGHWWEHVWSYDRPRAIDKWHYIKTTSIF